MPEVTFLDVAVEMQLCVKNVQTPFLGLKTGSNVLQEQDLLIKKETAP